MRKAMLALLALAIAVGTAGALSRPAAVSPAGSQDKEPPVVCSFANPSYTGLCEERTPYVKDKTLEAACKPILECLNDTRCVKTYCGSTTIRQGWVLESATRRK